MILQFKYLQILSKIRLVADTGLVGTPADVVGVKNYLLEISKSVKIDLPRFGGISRIVPGHNNNYEVISCSTCLYCSRAPTSLKKISNKFQIFECGK